MIDSISTADYFDLNLRERFFLEREIDILPSHLRKPKTSKNQKILEDLFINKVLSDPYFSIHISKTIEDSDFDLKDVFAYINYVLLENYLSKSPLLNNIEFKENTLDLQQALDKRKFDYYSLKGNTYYHDKWDFKKAIDALPFKGEGIKNRWSSMSLLNWDAVMKIPYYYLKNKEEVWNQMFETNHVLESLENVSDFRDEHRFIFENIESNFRYGTQTEYMNINAPLFGFLNFNTGFILSIKNLLEKYGYHKDFNNGEIGKYFKIYTDSILIGQFHWFVSLDENQMLSLLNAYYDEQSISFKHENLNIFNNSKLLHYFVYYNIRPIGEEKYYNETINLLSKLSESTDDMSLRRLCLLWMGDIYREINYFDSAANVYYEAYKVAKNDDLIIENELRFLYPAIGTKIQSHRVQNTEYVDLFNVAEMYHHAGNNNRANELIQQLDVELESLSIPKQMHIWDEIYRDIYSRQEHVSNVISNKIVELANRFHNSNLDYLEQDMEWIDRSEWDKEVSRMDYIFLFVNNLKSFAQKRTKDQESKSQLLTANLFVINQFYTWENQCKEKTYTEQLIASLGLNRDIIHIDETIPFVFAPNKRLEKIETAISLIRSMNNDEIINISNFYTGSNSAIIQRLKLKQARCYYLLNKNDIAQDILKTILKTKTEDGVDFYAHCMLGIIFAKKEMMENSIKHFKLAIDTMYLSEKGSEMVLEYCRDELIKSVSKEIFFEIVDSIIDHIKDMSKDESSKFNGFLQAVDLCNQLGLTEESLHFIERGLLESNELIKWRLLVEKAYVKYLDHDLDASQELLEKVREEVFPRINTRNDTHYRELALSVFHKSSIIAGKRLDFKKAERDISIAIKILKVSTDELKKSKLKYFETLKDVYHNLSKNIIEYDKIKDPEVRKILETGEMLLSDLLNGVHSKKIDYSIALAEYGKGLETLLDNTITASLREHIFSLHPTKPIEDSYFIGEGKFEEEGIKDISPNGLKDALNCHEHKTISLGSWKGFIQNEILETKKYKNPYLVDSYLFLQDYIKEADKWNVIAENCAVIKEYRNNSSHYGTKEMDYIFEKRADTIRKINEIIEIIYCNSK